MDLRKQFATYEIALKPKELGFDEPCFGIWIERGLEVNVMYVAKQDDAWMANQNEGILAPLWQQVVDWFREKYNYHISVYRLNNKWCGDVYDILRQCYVTNNAFNSITYSSYEEARKQAILKAIELCQKEK